MHLLTAALFAGLSWTLPAGWQAVEPRSTAVIEPAPQLAAATFPLRQTERDDGCSPDTAQRRLPADGAVVWLVESRDITPRALARLPQRPARFVIGRPQSVECLGHGAVVHWQEQGRALSAQVLLGREAGVARRREAAALLDTLVVERVPPPPPPAGWRTARSGTADSIRVPPGWSVRALRVQRGVPRPRVLYRLANPSGSVVLRVREHRRGKASPAFPAGRAPLAFDARRRAGLSFRGYRVSFRIFARAHASARDIAWAEVSARSAGFSWVGRE
ncbi:hypothetical protein OJ997_26355 [Solirubrobacter phytolaccae]|uniref:Uncharacterized protein n=1 Tax=Solirubrobacter phytolaccae TaxID=1404360 RepID=A0A9X3ND16_9ACTN|nr:hypothetical protein [Solirubrobacter phytolaccae]MDA0183856.1 hypothetical protein [Solirubrobacter phytolaccae]